MDARSRTLAVSPSAQLLVHMVPDAKLSFSHFDVSSTSIADLAVRTAYESGEAEELRLFLEETGLQHYDAAMRASLWRAHVLRAYSEGSRLDCRNLQQPGKIWRARVGPATVETVASFDRVEKGTPGIIWRLARGGLAAFCFLCLPNELCLITTKLDAEVDKRGPEEALKVLRAAAEGTGEEPCITWIAPRPEFDAFQLQQLNLDSGAATDVEQRVVTPLWPDQA